jgi:hypothetical protein
VQVPALQQAPRSVLELVLPLALALALAPGKAQCLSP